jgi:hypothetical protein
MCHKYQHNSLEFIYRPGSSSPQFTGFMSRKKHSNTDSLLSRSTIYSRSDFILFDLSIKIKIFGSSNFNFVKITNFQILC